MKEIPIRTIKCHNLLPQNVVVKIVKRKGPRRERFGLLKSVGSVLDVGGVGLDEVKKCFSPTSKMKYQLLKHVRVKDGRCVEIVIPTKVSGLMEDSLRIGGDYSKAIKRFPVEASDHPLSSAKVEQGV